MSIASRYSRRNLLELFAAISGAALAGCDRTPSAAILADKAGSSGLPVNQKNVKAIIIYRDPGCGCCEAWADIARTAGYKVTVENRADMAAVKAQHGVPDTLASCHTALVDGYAVEGHVPMRHIAKLLRDKPRDIAGIAVPGMPRGSPGMEMPDGSVDAFDVMSFDRQGKVSVFRA